MALLVLLAIARGNSIPVQGQDHGCGVLPTRLAISKAALVRDLPAGGNSLRAAPGLYGAVVGEIPAHAEVLVLAGPRCADGYQWYQVQFGDLTGWTAEGDSQEYWLEPVSLCPSSLSAPLTFFQLAEITTPVVDLQFLRAEGAVLISSLPPGVELRYRPPHEAQLSYHRFDLATRTLTEIPYPDADIVTRDLTDRLGVTEAVFGADSAYHALLVSPERDRVLYFVLDEDYEYPCCGDDYTYYEAWTANADGSDPRRLGITRQIDYVQQVHWIDDSAVLLIYNDLFGGGYTPLEVCLDGSCFNWLSLHAADGLFIHGGSAAISPDRRSAAINHFYDDGITVQDRASGGEWSLPAGLRFPLFSPIWSPDGQAFYYPSGESQGAVRAWVDAPDHREAVTQGVLNTLIYPDWLALPAYYLSFSIDSAAGGLWVRCD